MTWEYRSNAGAKNQRGYKNACYFSCINKNANHPIRFCT